MYTSPNSDPTIYSLHKLEDIIDTESDPMDIIMQIESELEACTKMAEDMQADWSELCKPDC